MVTTRRQQQQKEKQNDDKAVNSSDSKILEKRARTVSKEHSSPNKKQKAEATKDTKAGTVKGSNSSPSPSTKAPHAECSENQLLLNGLQELHESVSGAQAADPKLRFQAANLRKVITTLSKFDRKITSGKALASGKEKVEGLGRVTASYIDDFLKTGTISAIQHYQDVRKEYDKDPKQNHIIKINRAPVLTLWVMVVCERQGYTHEEALTHAKWISAILARSKGKSLGKFEKDEKQKSPSGDKTAPKRDNPKEHVFGHIKVPVESTAVGKRMAVMGDNPIVPDDVDRYLKNAFGGDDLERIKQVFQSLADSMDPQELREKAYDLYEELRPEWQGWAQPGKFDLEKVQALIQNH